MKRFYLTGQRTFGNRGCEAIVRSTVALLKEQFGDVEVLVPSDDIERDQKQWPTAAQDGVVFASIYYPFLSRLWGQVLRLPIHWLKQLSFPLPIPRKLKEQMKSVDAVLSIGGDMYTYEGRAPVWIVAMDNYAIGLNKPTILWCASVGPFDADPSLIPKLSKHFSKMSLLALRESVSEQYVIDVLGAENAIKTSDPAFHLVKQKIDMSGFWPQGDSQGVLGLNVSPLIERFSTNNQNIVNEIAEFVRFVFNETHLSVLLISHVTPLDHSPLNSDYHYLNKIMEMQPDLHDRVSIMPDGLNALEIKYVISQCKFFIGARTHATIAALSSCVPTISIAYSQKAKGLNEDVFKHQEYVLPTNNVSKQRLIEALQLLIDRELEIKNYLSVRIPELQELTVEAMKQVANIIEDERE